MAVFRIVNLKKTYYYLRRNGLQNTWYAAREKLSESRRPPYLFEAPAEEELKEQRRRSCEFCDRGEYPASFSILVPAYRTRPQYLREMINSLCQQSYPYWELILADATEDDSVKNIVMEFENAEELGSVENGGDDAVSGSFRAGQIRYLRLSSNGGISENTNAAIPYARGNYVGLLDHDDILTGNALYEMAEHIRMRKELGAEVKLLYSDEDKCNSDGTRYYEPNRKEDFNLDLILSNNYICHFLVIKRGLLEKLRFRRQYEGAQDYDLILRAVSSLDLQWKPENEAQVVHIPKVLYHWRCHEQSTAENPRSKEYAYEAGQRALQNYADRSGIDARAVMLRHMGFYRLVYASGFFANRRDVGAVGGPVFHKGKIIGGRMDEKGNVFYEGLPSTYSGYLHRAVLTQDAEAVDIRCIAVRSELYGLFEQIVGIPYRRLSGSENFDVSALPGDCDYRDFSLRLCRAIRGLGYRIFWGPSVPAISDSEVSGEFE